MFTLLHVPHTMKDYKQPPQKQNELVLNTKIQQGREAKFMHTCLLGDWEAEVKSWV